jgi:Tc toxin complex TcA C-terminal TcB-binding domain
VAYLHNNTRLLEITSHISLRRLNPLALWNLRTAGRTGAFTVPTWLFDLDFPGHTHRRIKSVSLSVPCVVGPYRGVHGILSCTSESLARRIATSSGQNDAGVFQLDFRDERYLPFEGIDLDAGTDWELELPAVLRPFDYDTISDVVLHIQYTARYASAREEAAGQVARALTNEPWLQELISIRHDFPMESRQLREEGAVRRDVVLDDRLFPYFVRQLVRPQRLWQLSPASPPVEVTPSMLSTTVGGAVRLALAPEDADRYFLLEYGLELPL